MTHRGGPFGAPLILFLAVAASAHDVRSTVGPVETPLSLEAANFLLDRPELSAWLVRRRKLAPYVIERRGKSGFYCDDGDGTRGLITEVSRSSTTRVYEGEGRHGWIRASARVELTLTPMSPGRVSSTFDVAVKLKNPVLSLTVRALRPWLRDVIARKFSRAFTVAHQVGLLLKREPAALDELPAAERAELKAIISR